MTLFELVKIALDELYKEGQKEYGAALDDTIRKRMDYLSNSYSQLSDPDRNPVNYRDPATRFAYAYKYVAAHGDYVVQVLNLLRDELGGRSSTRRTRGSPALVAVQAATLLGF